MQTTTLKRTKVKPRQPPKGASRLLREIVSEQVRSGKWQARHGRDDKRQLGELHATLSAQPTKADIQEIKDLLVDEAGQVRFATKGDVAEVLSFWNNAKLGARIISGGGKWGYRAFLVVITVFGAWAIFTGGLKALLLWLVSLVFIK